MSDIFSGNIVIVKSGMNKNKLGKVQHIIEDSVSVKFFDTGRVRYVKKKNLELHDGEIPYKKDIIGRIVDIGDKVIFSGIRQKMLFGEIERVYECGEIQVKMLNSDERMTLRKNVQFAKLPFDEAALVFFTLNGFKCEQ